MITARKRCYPAVVWLKHSPITSNKNEVILIKIETNYDILYENLIGFKFRVNHKKTFKTKIIF